MSSSPYTVPRLFRCRVRDLASCFYACRFPLEEEHEIKGNKTPQISNGSINLDCKCGKMSNVKKKICPKKQENSVQNSLENASGAEPRFADEDYIVFCFREDGEIHMINERKSCGDGDSIDEHPDTTSRTTNRKEYENKSKETETKWPPDDEIEEINPNLEQPNASKMDSFESCDSNLSDTSTSSFAFPVLGYEWIGSPVHMPKSEMNHPPSVCLHCCRF
ncbi:hypothetical protein CDL12_14725 [Handroanthus impetiginosus]|uniref:Uncharacterized protein n=1 Tax=Handroanthus impetiginosus TaxID=429701 RepID=A0A2G9H567_9LAMI|nr:hypothetical protein CDL12_14725 [Handroanthus impetiginosus]